MIYLYSKYICIVAYIVSIKCKNTSYEIIINKEYKVKLTERIRRGCANYKIKIPEIHFKVIY